jgi:hypothetical protein
MVRSKVKEDCVAQVETAASKVFSALQQEQPNGIRYASCKLADGVTFVVLLEVEDGADNPLPAMWSDRSPSTRMGRHACNQGRGVSHHPPCG